MAEPASVEVTLIPSDHLAMLAAVRRQVGPIRFLPLAVALLIMPPVVFAGWCLGTFVFRLENGAAAALGGILAYVAVFVVCARLNKIVLRRNFAPDGVYLSPREVIVEEEGVRLDGPNYSSFVRWPGVRNIVETKTHILLMLDISQSINIPKRCFASQVEAQEFLSNLRQRLGK